MVDRVNPAGARGVAEKIMPDPVIRAACLRAFAESVTFAHEVNPERWGVTLFGDLMRLNVGRIEVLTLVGGEFHILLHRPSITRRTHECERAALEDREGGFYKSVPESVACNFAPDAIGTILPLVRESHHDLIRAAALLPLNPASQAAHSPGVVLYLSQETGVLLVDPWYRGDAKED